MKIFIDLGALQNPNYRARGIGRYLSELTRALIEQPQTEVIGIFDEDRDPPLLNIDLKMSLSIVGLRTLIKGCAGPADWLIIGAPFQGSPNRIAEAFEINYPNAKIAAVFYDIIPLEFPTIYLCDPLERVRYQLDLNAALRADLLLCISDYTRYALVQRHPRALHKAKVIGTGVSEIFYQGDRGGDDLAHAWGVSRPDRFILTVSGPHFTKNFDGLLAAYAQLPVEFMRAHPLVVLGIPLGEISAHYARAADNVQPGLAEHVRFFPHVDDVALRELYRTCNVFVFASLYEGYGLPAAEALVSGAIVVASRATSLREIITDTRFQFDPRDPADIADKLMRAALSEDHRLEFRSYASAKRDDFRWLGVAAIARAELSAATGDMSGRKEPMKPVAIVGPVPPSQSGIATYTRSLLPHLAKKLDFRVFATDGSHIEQLPPSISRRKAYPVGLFNRMAHMHKQILYVIGNSFHHVRTWEALSTKPGLVWLHDVRLSGLLFDIAKMQMPGDPWALILKMLRDHYPEEMVEEASAGRSLARLFESELLCAGPLLKHAAGFIVHSNHARGLLERDLFRYVNPPQIRVVGLSIAPKTIPKDAKRLEYGTGPAKARIGMIGFMAPIRAPEVVIQACGGLRSDGWKVELRIIGACDDGYFRRLVAIADDGGVTLTRTGYLDDDDYQREIASLSCAVQIRASSNGESSATVADCIALDTPVVTNIPSATELWRDALHALEGTATVEKVQGALLQALAEDRGEWSERRKHVGSRFSPEVISAEIASVVRELAP